MFTFLNPFSIHNFLWYSALTPIFGYIGVYSEHYANTSASQIGTLNMILPFITILAKLYFCALADRKRAYRCFFVISIIVALVGYGSFGILPFFIKPQCSKFGYNLPVWAIICIMTALSTISGGVMCSLTDALVMNYTKRNNSSFGHVRLWGTIGWGLSSLIIAYINESESFPLLVPGIFMTILLLVVDIAVQLIWTHAQDYRLDKQPVENTLANIPQINRTETEVLKINATELTECKNTKSNGYNYDLGKPKEEELVGDSSKPPEPLSSSQIQWLLFKEVARRRLSIFRYMILFFISGALISLQWSYFFLFLKDIQEENFSFFSGLSMFGQSILGELPFFLLSQTIINALGRKHTLSLSIMSIGIRYLLYAYLLPSSSIYFVLLTEMLQGPNYSMFYVVLAEVGLDYSNCDEALGFVIKLGHVENKPEKIQKLRQALKATMQGVMSGCYEGLGSGFGAILGGFFIDKFGFINLWIGSAIAAILLGCANMIVDLLELPILVDQEGPAVCAKHDENQAQAR